MLFTEEKELQPYERLMKQFPYDNRNSGNRKYVQPESQCKYKDLACDYCLHHRKKAKCKYEICPYIIYNLDVLTKDTAFIKAIESAEVCKSNHKQTLIYIKGIKIVITGVRS